MVYGRVFTGLMLLWPLLAALGTLGFAPLVGILGLLALVLSRPRLPIRLYALLGLAFIAWAAMSETWSPLTGQLFSGNLLEGNFAIGARSLVIILTALFGMLTIAGVMRTQLSPFGEKMLLAAFCLHGVIVLICAVFSAQIVLAIYGDDISHAVNGIQNITRNINMFSLVLPLLAGLLMVRPGMAGKLIAAAMLAAFFITGMVTDNHAAVLTVGGVLLAGVVVKYLPETGFRWLVGGFGAYILAAPVVFSLLLKLLDAFNAYLPGSFQSRFWSWDVVISRIWEKPLTGHGLMATRTWRETYAEHPEWLARLPDFWAQYPVVPGHPHNMGLQIWAETGVVGAVLIASALIALGLRLPPPSAFRPEHRFAIAGLVGAGVMMFSFSYSVWAEGFWSGVLLMAASLILIARRGQARA